jgi:hypothetical protein
MSCPYTTYTHPVSDMLTLNPDTHLLTGAGQVSKSKAQASHNSSEPPHPFPVLFDSSSPFKKSISIAARTNSSSVAVREGSQPKNKSGQLHTVALHVRAQGFCMHSLDAPYPGTLGVV